MTKVHSDKKKILAYYSSSLKPAAAGLPLYLYSVAATIHLVEVSENIVLGCLLTVRVPHSVDALLRSTKMQHLSVSRPSKYEVLLLSASHITP